MPASRTFLPPRRRHGTGRLRTRGLPVTQCRVGVRQREAGGEDWEEEAPGETGADDPEAGETGEKTRRELHTKILMRKSTQMLMTLGLPD